MAKALALAVLALLLLPAAVAQNPATHHYPFSAGANVFGKGGATVAPTFAAPSAFTEVEVVVRDYVSRYRQPTSFMACIDVPPSKCTYKFFGENSARFELPDGVTAPADATVRVWPMTLDMQSTSRATVGTFGSIIVTFRPTSEKVIALANPYTATQVWVPGVQSNCYFGISCAGTAFAIPAGVKNVTIEAFDWIGHPVIRVCIASPTAPAPCKGDPAANGKIGQPKVTLTSEGLPQTYINVEVFMAYSTAHNFGAATYGSVTATFT